jgi:hypothetical protein
MSKTIRFSSLFLIISCMSFITMHHVLGKTINGTSTAESPTYTLYEKLADRMYCVAESTGNSDHRIEDELENS